MKKVSMTILLLLTLLYLVACNSTSSIICPECGYENLSGAKFCSDCGAEMSQSNFGNQNNTSSSHTHEFANYVSDNNATYEADGTKTAVCNRDGCNVTDTVVDVGSKLIFYSSGLNFTLNSDGSGYTVSDIGSCTDSDIVIPLTHNNKKVTGIVANVFKGYTFIHSVKLHENITSIGENAFYNCSGLTKIEIPENVSYIGDKAFWGCSNVSVLTFSAKNISDNNFGTWVFSGVGQNSNDVKLEFTDSVTRVPKSFCNCFNLVPSYTSIHLGANITEIGNNAFSNCQKVYNISIPNKVVSIGENAFCYLPITSIDIPSSVKSIGNYAFEYCRQLTNITLPSSIEKIGFQAFNYTAYYSNQSNWNYDLLIIDKYLVQAKETVSGPLNITNCYLIAERCFNENDNITAVQISGPMRSIGKNAFLYCRGLTTVTINPSVPCRIESSAFFDSSVSKLVLGENVLEIGGSAFLSSGLTEIEFNSTLKRIEDNAFDYCTGLTKFFVSKSVEYIGEEVFRGCSGLRIYCERSNANSSWFSQWNYSYETPLHVEYNCSYNQFKNK